MMTLSYQTTCSKIFNQKQNDLNHDIRNLYKIFQNVGKVLQENSKLIVTSQLHSLQTLQVFGQKTSIQRLHLDPEQWDAQLGQFEVYFESSVQKEDDNTMLKKNDRMWTIISILKEYVVKSSIF